jgi:hypothetical protein
MKNKYRFWQLIDSENLDSEKFSKIEIPILQRDYAQGRHTPEVKSIRKSFSSHLINSLCSAKPVELDFVYGSIEPDKNGDKVFIPLDGQQRLTTLFLLHWYLAVKEGKMNGSIKEKLKKFLYETRPSAHDFCEQLIDKCPYTDDLNKFIRDAFWYNDEWDNDPTVIGMQTMLATFQKNEQLNQEYDFSLFDRLINEDVITFYFITLEEYGLTEELYIRMNARGKILNDFENFKSEFYKIISNSTFCNDFKDKIEYAWVEELWDFRDKEKFTVDTAFMNYLRFITEMLYFKDSDVRTENYERFGKKELTNFEILKNVFSQEDNLKFLIFALDKISFFRTITRVMFWEKDRKTLSKIIEDTINGNSIDDNTPKIVLYSTLRYFYITQATTVDDNYYDFIRVIRNLTYNTKDKSRREWAKLFNSIEQQIIEIKQGNIYIFLSNQTGKNILDGFYVPQRNEEVLKAKIIAQYSPSKSIIFDAEENNYLKGNIICLLKAVYTQQNTEIDDNINPDAALFDKNYLDKLAGLLERYNEISKDYFHEIWGDLIITPIYKKDDWRITYTKEYAKHNAMMHFLLNYYYSEQNRDEFLLSIEKKFIQEKYSEYNGQLIEMTGYRNRLYLYYILTRRIMNLSYNEFFRNGYNFGWLSRETGFKSIFDKEGDKIQPVFQTYTSQFRYNFGLKKENALPPEIVGNNRRQKPFDELIEWSKK